MPRDNGGQFTLRVFACTKPVIGAINGPAVGVGATMTLPMDVRLAADDARMGFVFARRGIVPEACSSWFLPRVVGISRAMEWVSTGPRVLRPGGPRGRAAAQPAPAPTSCSTRRDALAREIADNTAPVSVALARRMMWRMLGAEHPMLAHRADSRGMLARGQSADAVEGITSFLEKRPARFTDRVSDGLPDIFPGLAGARRSSELARRRVLEDRVAGHARARHADAVAEAHARLVHGAKAEQLRDRHDPVAAPAQCGDDLRVGRQRLRRADRRRRGR